MKKYVQWNPCQSKVSLEWKNETIQWCSCIESCLLLYAFLLYMYLIAGLSTARIKMLIKYIENIFWLIKIIFNIVSGNLFPGTY